MLVEKLKEVTNLIGWEFNYGKGHWQNLQDLPDDSDSEFEERKKYFLLLWKDRVFKLNEYSAIEGYEYQAEAILCVRSNIHDEDYNFKYEEHISKLEQEVGKMFEEFTSCDNWTIKRWKEIEVENQYDTNLDGIKIQFTFSYE
ncbi:hypothetical protein V2605_03520 [Tenacibaculum maritimum]|uniref:hypothetical protein n=1 Tax=Tenacibaculum maritimum TaxID=107401 RepID=UPI0012E44340|nr:hypothetical protein [Tenacibaculum maritimum]CAA0254414.1 conserved hypothetical protein [Tenacibaculum maritimum]